jgi:O-antigen ligase
MSAALTLPELRASELQSAPTRSRSEDVALYGIGALLMFGPLAFGAVEPWTIFVLEFASAVLFAIWLASQMRTGKINLAWSPIFSPMLAFLGLVCLQLLPGVSAYRHATFSGLLLYVAYGTACFLIVQTLTRTRHTRGLATVLGVYGAAIALFAIFQSLSSPGKLYWFRVPRFGGWIYGPYVNHNHYAGLMEMLVPIPMVFAFSRYARGRKKWAAASIAAVMGATIFLSGSRGGMTAFAVQIAILFWFLFRERTYRPAASLLATFLIISLLLVAGIGGSEVAARLSTVSSDKRSELAGDIRLKINHDAIQMFSKRPVLGWGLGTFEDVYPQFRSYYTNFLVDEAHNDYAQLLVETGALGFAVMIWFLAATLRPAWRKMRNWSSDVNGTASLAAVLGIAGILVHSFVDFNLEIPANAMLFYVFCTIAAMDTRFKNHRREHRTHEIPDEVLA